jgi:enoyl-CoA hydratase/carnithine racemase
VLSRNGGGVELALRADILFASESAQFSHSEQAIAFVTVLGGIYRVAERAGCLLAYQWALTSEEIPVSVFAQHGLVNYIVPDASLRKEALNFAKQVAVGARHPTRRYCELGRSEASPLPTMSCSISRRICCSPRTSYAVKSTPPRL